MPEGDILEILEKELEIAMKRALSVIGVKADGWTSRLNGFFKRRKNRQERRKAKANPEAIPTYGKYRGWLS